MDSGVFSGDCAGCSEGGSVGSTSGVGVGVVLSSGWSVGDGSAGVALSPGAPVGSGFPDCVGSSVGSAVGPSVGDAVEPGAGEAAGFSVAPVGGVVGLPVVLPAPDGCVGAVVAVPVPGEAVPAAPGDLVGRVVVGVLVADGCAVCPAVSGEAVESVGSSVSSGCS